jgi:hypothetical protein
MLYGALRALLYKTIMELACVSFQFKNQVTTNSAFGSISTIPNPLIPGVSIILAKDKSHFSKKLWYVVLFAGV